MSLTTQPSVFIIAVLLVGLCSWLTRSLVESDPDPFFLNLTFFAFAGQAIMTAELLAEHRLTLAAFLLFLLGSSATVSQIYVLRAHMRTTEAHYRAVLRLHQKDSCADNEIGHWAKVLLQITGTDFSPGSYSWLSSLFASEPREMRRHQAFSILPATHFELGAPGGITPDTLTVPPDQPRNRLWGLYVGVCAAAWLIFVLAIANVR